MPIYRIFTPITDTSMYSENAQTYLKNITKHSILFSTEVPEDDPEDDFPYFNQDAFIGYRIPFLNEVIINNEEERDGITYNTVTFKNSNIVLKMQDDSDEYSPIFDLTVNGLHLIHDTIYSINGPETYEEVMNGLKGFIKVLNAKEAGRNIIGVARVGKNRQLPENVEGVMAEFLSGKKGHIVSQQNQLQQNVGIHLAPRVRPPKNKEGGKRRTYKKKRKL